MTVATPLDSMCLSEEGGEGVDDLFQHMLRVCTHVRETEHFLHCSGLCGCVANHLFISATSELDE